MASEQSKSITSSTAATATDSATDWFLHSLKCLGCDKPEDFLPALEDSDEQQQLIRLTLWLEECVIRLWTIEKRDQLKEHFWTNISHYLEELQCPACYYTKSDWQMNEAMRTRVVFWLVSVATSEAYGDAFMSSSNKNDITSETPVNTATFESAERKSNDLDLTALEALSESDLAAVSHQGGTNDSTFPLGFSTSDPQVDRILTLLRMNMLLDLEREQQVINQRIAQLQSLTVPEAKSLKKYKQQWRRRER